ncbi:MAG: helix-turn-helix transcriptional regulator [Oscillospiraceae bacterium]|nr:helix-turn-helix transcriptional regulator [Oscillospiraceae bacterium]
MIDYSPLWNTMKEKGVTAYKLVYKKGIPSSTIARLKHNKPCNTTTIDDLCRILDCRVEDIIRYVPDEE